MRLDDSPVPARPAELQFLRELHFIEALESSKEHRKERELQFLRELHFIEAMRTSSSCAPASTLQFLRELHFIEAGDRGRLPSGGGAAVPPGTALH